MNGSLVLIFFQNNEVFIGLQGLKKYVKDLFCINIEFCLKH